MSIFVQTDEIYDFRSFFLQNILTNGHFYNILSIETNDLRSVVDS